MRISSLIGWTLALFVGLIGTPAHAQEKSRKMNVLVISVDDLNTSLGCYGHPIVKTPNIDRLAKRGVKFERAYCQYPLCNPSRTSFMSGKRPDTTKIFDNTTPPRTTLGDVAFLNEYFARNGYYTARIGKIFHGAFADTSKWDVNEEPNKNKKKAAKDAAPPAVEQKKKKDKDQKVGGIPITWKATDNKDEDEIDGMTARRIVQLLEKNKDGPFFIAAGFHKPHLPFVAPKKYFDMYPPEKIPLPKEPADVQKNAPAKAFTKNTGDDMMTDMEKKQAIAAYFACVSFMDAQVGVILEAMDRLNLWENTIVIFVSDHGFHLSEHGGLWRKMTLFEESARVPLIVAAPGTKGGQSCPRLVELVDLYPTLTDACKLTTPKDLEGTSIMPLLSDPNQAWKKAAFTVVQRGKTLGRTVCTERYRYTEWGDADQAELYDHQTDPRELTNLASSAPHRQSMADMRKLLGDGWRAALPK